MDGGPVATHKGVRVDDGATLFPVFSVSLVLNKSGLSRADSICSTQMARGTVNLSRSDKNFGGAQ